MAKLKYHNGQEWEQLAPNMEEYNTTKGMIGTLANLLTTAKNNLVVAINEIFGWVEDVETDLETHKAEETTNAHLGKNIGIEDTEDNYEASDVEGALVELSFIKGLPYKWEPITSVDVSPGSPVSSIDITNINSKYNYFYLTAEELQSSVDTNALLQMRFNDNTNSVYERMFTTLHTSSGQRGTGDFQYIPGQILTQTSGTNRSRYLVAMIFANGDVYPTLMGESNYLTTLDELQGYKCAGQYKVLEKINKITIYPSVNQIGRAKIRLWGAV